MRSSFALDGALPHYFLPFLAALLVVAGLRGPAQAQEPAVFVIDANDGYGVADCLTGGGVCGQVVADAWCEAHGFQKAQAFGLASDVTAKIDRANVSAQPSKDAILIRCAE